MAGKKTNQASGNKKQSTSAPKGGSQQSGRQAGGGGGGGRTTGGQAQTGERDENYNLVSVLYHALQSAETMGQYVSDAQQADDDELASFFDEVRQNDVRVAQRARMLLVDRLEADDMDDDDDDEDDDEESESASA